MTFRSDGPWRATVDHLKPKAAGGGNHPSNLKLAHAICNHRRGNMSMEEWRASRQMPPETRQQLARERLAVLRRRELIRQAARKGMTLVFEDAP